MKKIFHLLFFAAAAFAAASCSNDDERTDAAVSAGSGNVDFVTRVPRAASARGPVYTTDEFRILAFRKSGDNYVYYKDIPLGGMTYTDATLSGTAQLPAGDYKFLPSYGLVTPGNYTWPTLTDATLADGLCITHDDGSFPAAFMLNMPLSEVPAYTVSLDGPKQTVNAKIRRAVSRVDVLFIRADRNPATGAYMEKKGDDVFGPEKLASISLSYTDASKELGMSGIKGTALFDVTHTLDTPAEALTMGTAESTTVGEEGYDFENVQADDIISGSAHLKGTYLIPNADNASSTGLTLHLTSGEGSVRTIALADPIPVERNKATLIRVYVLGDNVFTTEVVFAVEVDTVWDGSNFVNGEIN